MMEYKATKNKIFENLVEYIAKNEVQRSIKPIFKTDDFALYNEDSLEVMNRFPDNYVDVIFTSPSYLLYTFKIINMN